MSYRAFDVPTMIAISDSWVGDGRDKAVLESLPLTAGLVPILASAHNQLLRLHVRTDDKVANARTLSEHTYALDRSYDERYRALRSILSGWAAVSNETRRGLLDTIRDTLLPAGLGCATGGYFNKSETAETAASRLTSEMEQTLRGIVVDHKSMYQLFNEWVAVGRRLGEVDRERALLTEKYCDAEVSAEDVQNARYKWIRAVCVLKSLIDLDSDFPEEARLRILEPLQRAEANFATQKRAIDPTEGLDPTLEPEDAPLHGTSAKLGL